LVSFLTKVPAMSSTCGLGQLTWGTDGRRRTGFRRGDFKRNFTIKQHGPEQGE
jgi:hypothetical protein